VDKLWKEITDNDEREGHIRSGPDASFRGGEVDSEAGKKVELGQRSANPTEASHAGGNWDETGVSPILKRGVLMWGHFKNCLGENGDLRVGGNGWQEKRDRKA